ncbi:unnamed protein product [Adineta steineri]|uniref:Solute-binding protein family 3/N-terminal domain-containing protein n=1 Tax=Adineta steineri TaxID=433720 RepID=A0A815DAK4_9BILA|nr:unnamed protein product [Adineta steineri]
MGFIPQITLVPSNNTYNDLVYAVANGMYDTVVADVTVTSARREIVDFSASIFDDSLRIIIREASSINIDWLAFLKPFSRTLWLTILGTTIYASILIFLLERHHNEALQDRSVVSGSAMSVWYSMAIVLACAPDFNITTAAKNGHVDTRRIEHK